MTGVGPTRTQTEASGTTTPKPGGGGGGCSLIPPSREGTLAHDHADHPPLWLLSQARRRPLTTAGTVPTGRDAEVGAEAAGVGVTTFAVR